MTLRIDYLGIDDHILDKIETKHSVTYFEVEEACLSSRNHVRRDRQGLYKLFGRTEGGRYLLVVLVNIGGNDWKIVTARQMTRNEIRLYNRAVGRG